MRVILEINTVRYIPVIIKSLELNPELHIICHQFRALFIFIFLFQIRLEVS